MEKIIQAAESLSTFKSHAQHHVFEFQDDTVIVGHAGDDRYVVSFVGIGDTSTMSLNEVLALFKE